jgi:hypothetical protein
MVLTGRLKNPEYNIDGLTLAELVLVGKDVKYNRIADKVKLEVLICYIK